MTMRTRTYECVECGYREKVTFTDKEAIPDMLTCRECDTGAMIKLPAAPVNHFHPSKTAKKMSSGTEG